MQDNSKSDGKSIWDKNNERNTNTKWIDNNEIQGDIMASMSCNI